MSIGFVDWGSTSYIYADHNRKCEKCQHTVWAGYLTEICAWCGIAIDTTGEKPLSESGRRELLMKEYRMPIPDADKVKIMAIVLGRKDV